MTIKDYCISNIDEIINYEQQGFSWKKYNNHVLRKIASFDLLIQSGLVPEKISRDDVLVAFKNQEYFKGFILAILWGQIGYLPAAKSKGDMTTTNAYKAMSQNPDRINEILKKAEDLLKNNQLGEAYDLFSHEGKIDGVGPSYFTKFLFFLDIGTSNSKALIYDKWTKLLHVCLLVDYKSNITEFYTENSINKLHDGKGKTNLILCKSNKDKKAYLDYCERMGNLTNEINQETSSSLKSRDLESFLFGKRLTGTNKLVENNPRVWLKNKMGAYLSLNS